MATHSRPPRSPQPGKKKKKNRQTRKELVRRLDEPQAVCIGCCWWYSWRGERFQLSLELKECNDIKDMLCLQPVTDVEAVIKRMLIISGFLIGRASVSLFANRVYMTLALFYFYLIKQLYLWICYSWTVFTICYSMIDFYSLYSNLWVVLKCYMNKVELSVKMFFCFFLIGQHWRKDSLL